MRCLRSVRFSLNSGVTGIAVGEKRKTRVIFGMIWAPDVSVAGCCAIVAMRSVERLACFSTRLKVSQGHQTWYHCICCVWFVITVL